MRSQSGHDLRIIHWLHLSHSIDDGNRCLPGAGDHIHIHFVFVGMLFEINRRHTQRTDGSRGQVNHQHTQCIQFTTVFCVNVGAGCVEGDLDEFTYTTSNALTKVGGARRGKALAVINPAEPPMIMRNTVSCLTDETPDEQAITKSVLAMIKEVQKYVPGYRLVNGPVFDDKRVTVFMEVEGLGDYLPKYAGNLDIMTAAATRTAEMFAQEIIEGTFKPRPVEVA